MHVEHSVHIKHSVKQLSDALLEDPSKWFPKAVGLHVAGIPVRKRVEVEFGQPARLSTWAVVPLTWKANYAENLFPVMSGKVDLSPVGKDETKLTVSGMYEPPLGKVGQRLDEAVMHNVAKGTVRELAETIASSLAKAVET